MSDLTEMIEEIRAILRGSLQRGSVLYQDVKRVVDSYGEPPFDRDLPPELEHPANKLAREAQRAEALKHGGWTPPKDEPLQGVKPSLRTTREKLQIAREALMEIQDLLMGHTEPRKNDDVVRQIDKVLLETSGPPVPESVRARAVGKPAVEADQAIRGAYRSKRDVIAGVDPDGPLNTLKNLLARIHRDGGQYTDEMGWRQSAKDADTQVALLNASFSASDVQSLKDQLEAKQLQLNDYAAKLDYVNTKLGTTMGDSFEHFREQFETVFYPGP